MGGRVTGERHACSKQEQASGEQADGNPSRQAALDVETERNRQERDEREQITLLETLRIGIGDLCRFEQQTGRQHQARHRKRDLCPATGPEEHEREPGQRARDDRPAG